MCPDTSIWQAMSKETALRLLKEQAYMHVYMRMCPDTIDGAALAPQLYVYMSKD
jgi:hypothetical protein